jgi:hypothetical protein
MKLQPTFRLLALSILLNLSQTSAGQNPETGWEIRSKVTTAFDLRSRTRLQNWVEFQHGVNCSFQRWRAGAILSYRMKPIIKAHREQIDDDNNQHLVFGSGYEYLHTVQNGKTKIEDRFIAEVTPRYQMKTLLFADRNRGEFRWVDGAYDFRYRNKLVVSDPLQRGSFAFTPYASGELYYDRNHHSWNPSQYGVVVEFPYKKVLMFDTYLRHQTCTSCGENP